MKLFECNTELQSYTYPIAKIIGCVVLIILEINNRYFLIGKIWDSWIIRLLMGGIIVPLEVLCIYISAAEMIYVNENRKRSASATQTSARHVEMTIEEIVSLIQSEDIIEIKVSANNKQFFLGARSDNKPGDSVFFDKQYYICEENFKTIESFAKAIKKHSNKGKIKVCEIDGIAPT